MVDKVVVIGDVMLDRFTYHTKSKRENPENSGVPLVNISETKKTEMLGGAANLAANIQSLLGRALVIGPINMHDTAAQQIIHLFKTQQIEFYGIQNKAPTIIKNRIFLNGVNQRREETEEPIVISNEEKKSIIGYLRSENPSYIVISDYAKGMIDTELVSQIKIFAAETDTKVLVDTKPKNIEMFGGAYLIKPNFKEFCEMIGKSISNTDEDVEREGTIFVEKYQTNLVVTRSEKGATVISREGEIYHLPTHAKDIIDVTGAGDTFLAGLVTGLAEGKSLKEAVQLGNKASGIVVSKKGTSVVTRTEFDQ